MASLNVASPAATSGTTTVPVSDFLGRVSALTPAQKTLLVEQALILMGDLYVHLPLKRAMYAVEPVQRLRLLRHRIPEEHPFHEEMISIFNSVRDLHTNYILPEPYRSATAALPFSIGEYFQADKRRYIVFATAGSDPDFRPGMPVTHWNGVPIERAVELNARNQAGGNDAAKHARGLQRMTVRPLMMSLPPDEEWVDVRYVDASGAANEKRFAWTVMVESDATAGAPALPELSEASLGYWTALGLDLENEVANRVSRKLFASSELKVERDVQRFLENAALGEGPETMAAEPDFGSVSMMPEVFEFSTVSTTRGNLGRIRIKTFNVNAPGSFVAEFVRIAALLPQDRLVIDVRGNGGGNIIAGETLLQTLTGKTIEPERLQFLNRPLVLKMAEAKPSWFAAWLPSLRRAVTTGAVFSQGLPLLEAESYNQLGRKYPGKVILLTDAFCYSTTDIFSAGFRDHNIGPILGTMGNTGAGGANVFDWQLIAMLFNGIPDSPIRTPPLGASFRVAIRRTLRVGPNAGVELEDLGVEPDELHNTTLKDLLEQSADLYQHAADLLEQWR